MDGTEHRPSQPFPTTAANFSELMNNLRVSATSGDGHVKATLTLQDGIKVELGPRMRQDHDEASLGEAVTTAVRGALQGYSKVVDRVSDYGADSAAPPEPSPERRARRRKFMEAVAKIDVEVTSPRQLVKVRMDFGGIQIRVRPGVLSRIDVGPGQITTDMNDCIAAAHQRYRREYRLLRDKY